MLMSASDKDGEDFHQEAKAIIRDTHNKRKNFGTLSLEDVLDLGRARKQFAYEQDWTAVDYAGDLVNEYVSDDPSNYLDDVDNMIQNGAVATPLSYDDVRDTYADFQQAAQQEADTQQEAQELADNSIRKFFAEYKDDIEYNNRNVFDRQFGNSSSSVFQD